MGVLLGEPWHPAYLSEETVLFGVHRRNPVTVDCDFNNRTFYLIL